MQARDDSTQAMDLFNIEELTAFNQALIYGFDPERSGESSANVGRLIENTDQYQDMFNAYRYAQDILLPKIKEKGVLEEKEILDELNEVHKRIALTLGKMNGFESGIYTPRQVLRWEPSFDVSIVIQRYLILSLANIAFQESFKKNPPKEFPKEIPSNVSAVGLKIVFGENFLKEFSGVFTKKYQKEFSSEAQKDFPDVFQRKFQEKTDDWLSKQCQQIGADLESARKFIEVINKIQNNPNWDKERKAFFLSPAYSRLSKVFQKDPVDAVIKKAVSSVNSLVFFYQKNILTPEDKKIVDRIVTVCAPPEEMSSLMQAYANQLVIKWRECNPKDIDSVVDLLFYAFFNLTEIHPYPNGNGRLATLMLNWLLSSFGYTSILLRNPSERTDATSSYSKAIKNIKTNPSLMREHLKQRIIEAQNGKAFNDNTLKEIVCLRIRMAMTLNEIKTTYKESEETLEKIYIACSQFAQTKAVRDGIMKSEMAKGGSKISNDIILYLLKTMTDELESNFTRYVAAKKMQQISSLQNLSLNKTKFTSEIKARAVNCLRTLTDTDTFKQAQWTTDVKDHNLIVNLNFLKTDEDAEHAIAIFNSKFANQSVVKISKNNDPKTKTISLSFEILDVKKLLANVLESQLENRLT